MHTFAELLAEYMARTGISDAELARSIGVRRQTIFRCKEGLVSRPRHRDDVLRCARRLRLTPEERDTLLVAAGFPPEDVPALPVTISPAESSLALPAHVVEVATPRVSQPVRRTLPLRWVTVVAVLVAVGILLMAVWLTHGPTTYPVASEGETLIVVGRFVNYAGGQSGYNVAGRIRDALKREIEAARLAGVRVVVWPEAIPDEQAAKAASRRAGATIVIWGEYDSGRVVARFVGPGVRTEPGEHQLEERVTSPSDLSATINSALPAEVRYVALLTLGQLYADADDFDHARAVLIQALTQPPTEPDARATLYFRLGYVYQKGEPSDPGRAVDFYSHAIALQPGRISAYNNRGVAYLHRGQAGDLDRSIEDLTQVIVAIPNDAVAYNNRGAAYLRRNQAGDLDRSIADLTEVIAVVPDDAAAYNNRGAAYLQRNGPGDLARAVEDFSRAIDLAPDAPEAYFNRGLVYVRGGKSGQWLEDFEQVLGLDPGHAGALNALCWA